MKKLECNWNIPSFVKVDLFVVFDFKPTTSEATVATKLTSNTTLVILFGN